MTIGPTVKKGLNAALDLAYPRNCIGCGAPAGDNAFGYICAGCARDIYRVEPPCCSTCGFPFHGVVESERSCPHCEDLEPVFEEGRTVILHRGLGREMIHALKYQNAAWLLDDMERIMRQSPGLAAYVSDAALVPVPLHRRKRRERGFNQSERLAARFAAIGQNTRILSALQRLKDTASQTRLNREERRKNMRNAFSLLPGIRLEKDRAHILLDDVFTTGATLNACCAVLRRAGAARLKVLTFGHG